jgi:hypothetical protein
VLALYTTSIRKGQAKLTKIHKKQSKEQDTESKSDSEQSLCMVMHVKNSIKTPVLAELLSDGKFYLIMDTTAKKISVN